MTNALEMISGIGEIFLKPSWLLVPSLYFYTVPPALIGLILLGFNWLFDDFFARTMTERSWWINAWGVMIVVFLILTLGSFRGQSFLYFQF
jgi:hypothetical protein